MPSVQGTPVGPSKQHWESSEHVLPGASQQIPLTHDVPVLHSELFEHTGKQLQPPRVSLQTSPVGHVPPHVDGMEMEHVLSGGPQRQLLPPGA